jgi:hypothetical protein
MALVKWCSPEGVGGGRQGARGYRLGLDSIRGQAYVADRQKGALTGARSQGMGPT